MNYLYFLSWLIICNPVRATVILTFDDSTTNTYEIAFPKLTKHNIKATVYSITGLVGHKPFYMTWDELWILRQHGWDIECHTVSHPHLITISHNDLLKELDGCKSDLYNHGYTGNHFAAPYGELNKQARVEIDKRFLTSRRAWSNKDEDYSVVNLDNHYLPAVSLNESLGIGKIKSLLNLAGDDNHLVIFMIHQVVPKGSNIPFSISIDKFDVVLNYIEKNKIPTNTIDRYFDGK